MNLYSPLKKRVALMTSTADSRSCGSEISKKEGDRIARMVLDLVSEIVHSTSTPLPVRRGPEPTGAVYTREMAPWVEQRSDTRRR